MAGYFGDHLLLFYFGIPPDRTLVVDICIPSSLATPHTPAKKKNTMVLEVWKRHFHLDPGFVALKVWGPGSPMLQTLWFQPPVATTSGVWSPRVGMSGMNILATAQNLHVQNHQNIL